MFCDPTPGAPPAVHSLPVSVVIIARNEEAKIADCVKSARQLTDDILVLDSFSDDRTVEIARAAGARVICRQWPGYSDQKNFGNSQAAHDWILSLDADERVTPELAAAIVDFFARGCQASACHIKFHSHLGTRLVRFGAWNPEYHIRLFDRRCFRWDVNEVHEGLVSDGPQQIARLRGEVLHFTVASPAQLAEKSERYASLFAAKLRRRGRAVSWWKIWLNPGIRFVRDYILKLGVLDGAAGFIIAWEAARYTHLKYLWAFPETSTVRSFRWAPLASAVVALIALLQFSPLHSHLNAPNGESLSAVPADTRLTTAANDDDDSLPTTPVVDDAEVVS